MKSLIVATLALALSGCAMTMGAPAEIPVPTAVFGAEASTPASEVAAALVAEDARAAIVMAPAEEAWFAEVAAGTGLEASRGGQLDGARVTFLAEREALGDTTVTLGYDGGRLRVHDALYELEEDRFLDLLAFRIADPTAVRPALAAFLEYVATDVMNQAAVVIAVAVPSADVGDEVARLLSPGFFDALRCEPGLAPRTDRAGVRVFYGPEARVFCESAETGDVAGADWVVADLIMGRR